MNKNRKNKFLAYSLGVLHVSIGVTAVAGGMKLVSNPTGDIDFPIEQ